MMKKLSIDDDVAEKVDMRIIIYSGLSFGRHKYFN
jgi:hypothetical protein